MSYSDCSFKRGGLNSSRRVRNDIPNNHAKILKMSHKNSCDIDINTIVIICNNGRGRL